MKTHFAFVGVSLLWLGGFAFAAEPEQERHPVRPADPGVHVVNLAGEPVRRQPFDDGVGIEDRLT